MRPALSDSNPFWDFSLEIYGRPRVAEACIALQEETGADVNLVLFCVWLASKGRLLDDAVARECIAVTHAWQSRIVTPLRALRRASRHDATIAPELLRDAIGQELARVELYAERIEQELLFGYGAGSGRAADAAAAAQTNLANYFAAAGIVMNERAGELIEQILAAT